ncbi:translocation/assembly module TamB domain-containing protein [Halomonas kalidii]|uniref:Translocation/assembly module TamB domain-containing protein n=1 Tax=Halomonas kalidii TaxID=3043293 RepID=A0ABT6VG63_9GAMM|nr:translocation/assembly module TamB domain-containing protein [Halomonas kalidii]MDI5932960.1 translocation/assembly module TamB domain-containing protein [Halomonas kalidii]
MRARVLIWALIRLLILLPLWLLGLAVLVLGLALSPWGTGLLLEEGAERGFFELEGVEGAPLDTLVLHGLRLEAGPARVAAERIELAWADDCLLGGRLCLDALVVEGARIRLAGTEVDDEDDREPVAPLESISLPFPVEIRSLALLDVEVQLADGTRITWERFNTGAVAEADTLTLLPTRLAGTRVLLPLSPGARLALSEAEHQGPRLGAAAIDAAIAVRSPLPAAAAAELEGLAGLPLEEQPRRELPEVRLPLRIEAPELRVEDVAVAGPMEYRVRRLDLALTGEGHRIEIAPLEVTTVGADASLTASIELRDDYPLEARLEAALWRPEAMPELAGERIDLALDGDLGDLGVRLGLSGPVTASLDARLDALDPTLPFTASLESDLLQWPFPGTLSTRDAATEEAGAVPTEPYLVEDLSLRLEGSLLAYRVAASLMVEGPEIPYSRVALTGTGDLEHFAWTPLSASLGRASVVTRGRVDWADDLGVEAVVRLDNLDPGDFTDGITGRLDGDAELAFVQSPAGWQLRVPRLAIDGELQELPMSLRASLAGDSEMRWRIDTLDFRQGDNRLTAIGGVSERAIDLAGELNLPALANLHDELSGSLAGEFTGSGTLDSPRLDLDLTGEALRFAEHRLERLRLAGRVSGMADPALDLGLDIERLDVAGQRFSEVSLRLDGRLSAHRLTLDATAGRGMPLSRVALALEGGMEDDRQRYAGRLLPLEVDTDHGDIRLAEALAFEANLPDGSIRVQPFCLRREQGGDLCLEESMQASAERGQVALAIRGLPMSLIEAAVPEDWELAGATDATLLAEWRQGGTRWQADLGLASELAVRGLDAYGQPWELPPSRLTVSLEANQASADLDLALSLAEAGDLSLVLRIEDPIGSGNLNGRFSLDDFQLSRYRTLMAGMETLEGALEGEVRIGGSREAPVLDGTIGLSGLQVVGGEVPLEVRDGELEVRLAGDQGRINGFVAAEEGRLEIDGDASWPSPDDWRIAVDLDARERPLLAVLPEFGRLRVAPDLRVRVQPDRLRVRGEVQVPWARLEIGEMPESAVTPSPDEVIITRRDEIRAERQAERAAEEGEEGADASAARALAEAGMAVDVQIDLQLGPDMHLEAYGLESGLAGILEVRQQNGPVQLFGDVNLVDGRFRAFGQDLLIRRGELLFSGPPDQPLLNFEAIRNPAVTQDEVIAGLRVTGTAAEPQMRVFSEPAMDEARALSYLLRGRPPEDGDAEGALASALLGLTLGRTGGAVGAIGEAFGIDDLSLETAGVGDESQVRVSGQLTEDLRVSYGVGVFSPIAELTLRYTLWRNLYLEAVSGVAQAVDLVYTFSRPGRPPTPND